MIFCKKCVQSDSRPGIYFNEDGICGACLYQEDVEKNINWTQRESELKGIVTWAKARATENKSEYDCVIGISGGKDSTFQALYSRGLGLRPLLINCEPEGITEIGRKNIENLKNLGFDTVSIRPNPEIIKKLVRKDFFEFGNPIKATEFPLFSVTYIMADKLNIPLVIQGENPGLTLGVRNTGVGVDDNALNVQKSDTLGSGWQRYLEIEGVTEKDLFWYHYDAQKIKEKGVRAIWLQYYTKEWSQPNNAKFSISHGLTVRESFDPRELGTYVNYCQLDEDLLHANQWLKFVKFGFGQCTDHACYEIRDGLITREEGVELVKRYDGKIGAKYIKEMCDYLEVTEEEFYRVADTFRDPKVWWIENEEWWKDNVWGEPSSYGKVRLPSDKREMYKLR